MNLFSLKTYWNSECSVRTFPRGACVFPADIASPF